MTRNLAKKRVVYQTLICQLFAFKRERERYKYFSNRDKKVYFEFYQTCKSDSWNIKRYIAPHTVTVLQLNIK